MEWIPKTLDNLDSAALALYQSLAGYYRWVFLRLALTVVAVTAITISPSIRLFAIAAVVTYVFIESIDWLISRRKQSRVIRVQG